jgi:hypothetical protein
MADVTTSLEERESNFTIEATDRNTLSVFSNDTVWQARIEKLGIVAHRESGYGKFYKIDLNDFSFGLRVRRKLNDEQRQALRERLTRNSTEGIDNVLDDDDDENE